MSNEIDPFASEEPATEQAVIPATPVSEVMEIISFKGDIEAWMGKGPEEAIRAAVEAVKGVSIAACAEGPAAGLEAVKAAKKSLATVRLRRIEDDFGRFKKPVTAVGKRFDKRKNELLAMVEPREAELAKEIKDYEDREKERIRLEEERKKARTNARIQFAMQNGIMVDPTDAEQMEAPEWEAHVLELVRAKEAKLEEERKREAARLAAEKQITDRIAEAHRLGVELSREDAEYLTAEEFEAMRSGWADAKAQRDAIQRDIEERRHFCIRASEAGFFLAEAEILTWEDREASFMLWLGGKAKEKAAADRLTERLAQLEELNLAVSMKQVKELDDREWGDLLRSLAPVPVAPEAVQEAAASPKEITPPAGEPGTWREPVIAPNSGIVKSIDIPNDSIPEGELTAALAAAKAACADAMLQEVKIELSQIQAKFLAFGKSLPNEELKSKLRPIYSEMVALVGKL